ncbi:oligosaccharide flippase family protein [Nocardioides sp. WS12]|uniref:lipopolysaccharide biosynthesis protein n=1 Tax=Nocardioides sp. WS12 TaxID=2486272 RepID=UPI0015FBAE72|nr:oligosaccharide flippase family protein [Nocardioides sp. WS12]
MIRRFLRDGAVYFIPTVLTAGVGFVMLPLYTRLLNPGDFGSLDLLVLFSSIVRLTLPLEVTQAVALFRGDATPADRDVLTASAWRFTCAVYVGFVVVAGLAAVPLSRIVMGRDGLVTEFMVGIVYIALGGLFYFQQSQLRFELRARACALVSVAQTFAQLCGAAILAWGLDLGLLGFIGGMTAGMASGVVMATVLLRTSLRGTFSRAQLRRMLRFSLPLVPSGVAVFVTASIGRYGLNAWQDLDEVGIYALAFRVSGVLLLITGAAQAALTPLVYARHGEAAARTEVATLLRYFATVMASVVVTFALFAPELLDVVGTDAYARSAQLVGVLAPGVVMAQLYVFFPGPFVARRTGLVLAINAFGACVAAGLVVALVPSEGATGAGWAALISSGATLLAYILVSQRLWPAPHAWLGLGVLAIVTVGICVAAQDVREAGPVASLGAIAVVPVIALATRLVRPKELSRSQ